jgi:hypothetical protein
MGKAYYVTFGGRGFFFKDWRLRKKSNFCSDHIILLILQLKRILPQILPNTPIFRALIYKTQQVRVVLSPIENRSQLPLR